MLNYEIAVSLVKKHIQVRDQRIDLACAGVQMEFLDQLALFDIALDVIGFPEDAPIDSDTGLPLFYTSFDRNKWDETLHELQEMDVENFVKQLYEECSELLLQQPYLFVKK